MDESSVLNFAVKKMKFSDMSWTYFEEYKIILCSVYHENKLLNSETVNLSEANDPYKEDQRYG
jgi:hypothetical protein